MAIAAGLFLIGLSFAPDAEARTSCSYTGAPSNLLTVNTTGEAITEIRRKGQEIVIRESFARPRPCSGGVPTVLNTDTITVVVEAFVELRLGGGPFAPGATPEAEGASEIEVELSVREGFGEVVGTPRDDEFHWGPGGAHAGLNLNARSAGDQDIDVTLTGREHVFLDAKGAAGNDTIIPAPGAVVPDGGDSDGGRGDDLLIAPQNGALLVGGSGNDVLSGGRSSDGLYGGTGNDRVAGGGGRDRLLGGPGRALLSGGRGRDSIDARDSTRDGVRCGPGRDSVRADRRDRLRGCELISRR